MLRERCLIHRIADIDNLSLAFVKACRGKQGKHEVAVYRARLEENLSELRSQILSGNVDVGHYTYFTIRDPKERVICAAPFRERVLHNALMNVCHEYFDRSLIDSTYATRPGKGVYSALDKAKSAFGKYEWSVKLDYRKYFDNVEHVALKAMLERKFADDRLLSIFGSIIDSYEVAPGKGLPIGNITSQYFANMYLSGVDHAVKEKCRVKVYIRYMDDILMVDRDRDRLKAAVSWMEGFSSRELSLTLKPPVCKRTAVGQVFLGYRVLPYRLALSGRSKRRFRSKLLDYDRRLNEGEWTESQYRDHILPLTSFVQHASSERFRRSCLAIQR